MRNIVIGIGNTLRADDGVGVHVVERLREERPEIEAVDLSTANVEILEYIRNRDRVVIVDAMRSGSDPGTVRKIRQEEIKEAGFRDSHGLDLSSLILLGRQLYPDEMPDRITIIGVEAEDIESFTSEMTEYVEKAIPKVIEAIENELK